MAHGGVAHDHALLLGEPGSNQGAASHITGGHDAAVHEAHGNGIYGNVGSAAGNDVGDTGDNAAHTGGDAGANLTVDLAHHDEEHHADDTSQGVHVHDVALLQTQAGGYVGGGDVSAVVAHTNVQEKHQQAIDDDNPACAEVDDGILITVAEILFRHLFSLISKWFGSGQVPASPFLVAAILYRFGGFCAIPTSW